MSAGRLGHLLLLHLERSQVHRKGTTPAAVCVCVCVCVCVRACVRVCVDVCVGVCEFTYVFVYHCVITHVFPIQYTFLIRGEIVYITIALLEIDQDCFIQIIKHMYTNIQKIYIIQYT